MNTGNDPILDLQNILKNKSLNKEELKLEYDKLGWEASFDEVFNMALGIYIEQDSNGLYKSRNGNILDLIRKQFGAGL